MPEETDNPEKLPPPASSPKKSEPKKKQAKRDPVELAEISQVNESIRELQASLRDAMKPIRIDPEVFKSIKTLHLDPELFKSIKTPLIDPDVFKAVKNLNFSFPTSAYWSDIAQSEAPRRLRENVAELERRAQEQAAEIKKHSENDKAKAVEIDKLRGIVDELNKSRRIQFLLDSVTPAAHAIIEKNEEFQNQFTGDTEVKSFVVSVDIRRSTELMLKARSPKLFAAFITTLCHDLEEIFKENWAVVDKFTGDGILAFFPEFFSGDDAGYLALKAATEANKAFVERYREFRSSFSTILRDVGLGTGIDYGDVHLVRMAGALTIVGQPVVYACRMGGAPAGKVYLNQPAYEVVNEKYSHLVGIEEQTIQIKSEGALLCYDAQLGAKEFEPAKPKWLGDQKKEDEQD